MWPHRWYRLAFEASHLNEWNSELAVAQKSLPLVPPLPSPSSSFSLLSFPLSLLTCVCSKKHLSFLFLLLLPLFPAPSFPKITVTKPYIALLMSLAHTLPFSPMALRSGLHHVQASPLVANRWLPGRTVTIHCCLPKESVWGGALEADGV